MNIFTYGSLMFEEVWSRLISNTYDRQPASLSGYACKVVSGQHYPAIYQDPKSTAISGVVYFDLHPSDVATLDRFEGDYYQRITERLTLPGDITITADVYVLRDTYRHIVSNNDWDADIFKDRMHHFIDDYFGFSKV